MPAAAARNIFTVISHASKKETLGHLLTFDSRDGKIKMLMGWTRLATQHLTQLDKTLRASALRTICLQ